MKNMSKVLVALVGGAVLSVAAAQSASADSSDYYIDQAVNALGGSNVYVGGGSVSSSTIADAIDVTDIAVVVLPSDSVGGALSSTDIAEQILNQVNGQYETVLVYQEGGNPGFASDKYDATELSTAAYAPFNDGGALQDNIIESVDAVEEIPSGGIGFSGGDDAMGFNPLWVILPVVIVIAVLTTGIVAISRKRKRDEEGELVVDAITSRLSGSIPEGLGKLVRDLQKIAIEHDRLKEGSLRPELARIVTNTQQLFERIERKGTASQVRIAEIEYVDKYKKLNEALGSGYYIDIIKDKKLWPEPEERLTDVRNAVNSVELQLVENIKQVNASKDLEFRVALDSLQSAMESPNVKSIYQKEN